MQYYIYHIKGVKIGVTEDIKRRTKEHEDKYTLEVIEKHDCIYKASDREIELQKQYGYSIDKIPYWRFVKIMNSPQANKKISEALIGKKQSEETKLKRSKTLTGLKRSEECVKKIKDSNTGISRNSGYKQSEEHKQKRKEGQYKPISRFSLENIFEKDYPSQKAVKEDGYSFGDVNSVLRGKQKTAGGKYWRYKS